MKHFLTLGLLLFVISGCTIKHQYQKPSGPSYQQQQSSATKGHNEL
jgi:hypothetical protein